MAELIGTAETARLFGVSTVTVWRWSQEGALQPVQKIGRQLLFDRGQMVAKAEIYRRRAGREAYAQGS
jgi:predicted site-specific integrase-resolvase